MKAKVTRNCEKTADVRSERTCFRPRQPLLENIMSSCISQSGKPTRIRLQALVGKEAKNIIFSQNVIFGQDAISRIGKLIKASGKKQPVIFCGRMVSQTPGFALLLECLRKEKISYKIFDYGEKDATISSIMSFSTELRNGNFDVALAVGGGSIIDTTKLATLLPKDEQEIETFVGVEKISFPILPIIAVPTTAGSGSEATHIAVYRNSLGTKKAVVEKKLLPFASIIDPQLTISLDKYQTAVMGVDALSHATEAFLSTRATSHSDFFAVNAIKLILASLQIAICDGKNLPARSDMALGSFLAGVANANAGVGLIHALAYPVAEEFGISHGESIAIVFEATMEFYARKKVDKYEKISAFFSEVGGFAHFFDVLSNSAGIKRKLSVYGTTVSLESFVEKTLKNERLLANAPAKIGFDDALRIFQNSM